MLTARSGAEAEYSVYLQRVPGSRQAQGNVNTKMLIQAKTVYELYFLCCFTHTHNYPSSATTGSTIDIQVALPVIWSSVGTYSCFVQNQ